MTKSKLIAFVAAAVLLGTTTVSAATMFTKNLGFGMRDAEVSALQQRLNTEVGTSLPGTTYFGSLTRSAVKSYQTMKGISPVSGYVGPLTRAALNGSTSTTPSTNGLPAGCSSTLGYSSTTGVKCDSTGSTPTQTGPISVMLSSDNPAAGTIVAGQATADLAHFTFTGSGTVNTVMLKRSGISDQNTLTNVYLYDGVTRLTDGYSFNSNGDITINNLGLTVNGSRTISVKADVYASAPSGQTIAVWLTSVTTAGGTPSTVSLGGNTMAVASGSTLATVVFNAANTVSSASVNAGTTAYTFWSNAVQVNTRTLWLKSANFRMIGSAPSDALSNIKLYVDGVDTGKVASVMMMNGSNYAVFDLTSAPVSLSTGSHTVSVRADVQKGSNRTVQFSIQQAADLMIMDPQVGVNVAVTGSVPSNAGTITVSTGSATAIVDPTFQTMTSVTGGASNVVIGKFKVHGYGEDIKVSTLKITPSFPSSPTGASGLDEVALYFNGSQVGSSQDWTSGDLTYTLGSQMIIPAGADSTIEIRANLRTSNGSTNYTDGSVRVNLTSGSGLSYGQGMNSFATVDFPSSAVTGTTLSIQTGVLSVGKNTSYSAQTFNPNTQNVKVGSFSLQNQSSAESVRVTSLAVGLTSDGSTAATSGLLTNFSNLKTSETTGSGATPQNPSASNTFSVDFTLAPGASKVIDIFADLGSYDAGNLYVTLLPSAIGTPSNVTLTPSSATVGQQIALASGTFGTPAFVTSGSTVAQFVAAAGGLTDGTVSKFKFTATNGAATISELKFSVTGAGSVSSLRIGSSTASVQATPATTTGASIATAGTTLTVASVTGISAGTILTTSDNSEQMLVTAVASSTTLTVTRAINSSTATFHASGITVTPNGVAYFTGLNIAVPNGGSGTTIDVYPTYSNVGTNGIASATTSAIQLTFNKYTIGGTTTSAAMTPVSAPTMTMVGSKPTVTVGAVANGTYTVGAALTNKLSASTIEAIDIAVSADAKGDITLASLPITVTLNGANMATSTNNLVVKDKDNSTITTTNSTSGFSGGTMTISFTGGYLISAGQTAVFRIYVPIAAVTGTGVNGASISTTPGAGTTFAWTDTAGGGSWTSGVSNIPSYPTTSASVLYN